VRAAPLVGRTGEARIDSGAPPRKSLQSSR
jgi:hypothetical protein